MMATVWPAENEPGQFKLVCSCKKWEFIGNAKGVYRAAREHDDSPGTNHIVVIIGRVVQGASNDVPNER